MEPIGRITFTHSTGSAPAGWGQATRQMARWVAQGCGQIIGTDGVPLDIVDVADATPERLSGCVLAIYHEHLLRRFQPKPENLDTSTTDW